MLDIERRGPFLKVNIAVCGRFHYHNYVRYLNEAGVLGRFFYSHRLTTTAASLGISASQAINIWPKEYLIALHARLTGGRLVESLAPLYATVWETGALRRWVRCDVLHLMLHGSGPKMLQRAKREESLTIVEAVNQHPVSLSELLDEERDHLKIRRLDKLFNIQKRQIEELGTSDFLLAPSAIVRDSFVKRGFDPKRTAVLPYGVNLRRFTPLGGNINRDQRSRTFRVICVAQISARKGQAYLLEAWKRLALPSAELLLIGTVANELEATLRPYRGLFRHINAVPNHDLRNYYRCSTVFVLPSVEDGFAIVCLEAMACGLPVITTVNNGASEIIDQGKDGFIVPIRSAEAIAASLETLYLNREMLEEMSQAALTKSRSMLSWEHYSNRLYELYRSLTASEPSEALLKLSETKAAL